MSQSRVRCDSEKPALGPDALLHRQDPRTAFSILQRPAVELSPGADHEPSANRGFRYASSASARCSCKARICNQYKTRKTKSYAFLLVFVCAVVLRASSAAPVTASGQRLILHSSQYRQRHHQQLLMQQRQQQAPPTQAQHHHLHHRSAPNMPEAGVDSSICKEVQTLQQLLRQVNLSYDYIRNKLLDYTENQHNSRPEDLHARWKIHEFHLKHPLSEYLGRDFDKVLNVADYPHLMEPLTRETIIKHMKDVYITLKTLEKAFIEVQDDRKRKKDELIHDLLPGKDLGKIEAFITDARIYLAMELQVAIEAMQKLNISLPPFDHDHVQLDNRQMRDWLLIREHLKVMQYLRMLYGLFLSKCF